MPGPDQNVVRLESEWDRFVYKIGLMTLAMGTLEATIMTMHCDAIGKPESALKSRLNKDQRKGLLRAIAPLDWPAEKKIELNRRMDAIALLDDRRNHFIHFSAAVAQDDSLPGIPPGSVINLRSYGLGVMSRTHNSTTFGIVAERVNLDEIDKLTEEINQARVDLVPFMELVDKIGHSPMTPEEYFEKSHNTPVGKRLHR